MARVTATEVREIIDTDLTDTQIDVYIAAAESVVAENLEDKGLAEATLKEIERWLSAHFIAAVTDRPAILEKAGPVEQRFSDVFGPYLKMTAYGQTAIMFDTSGTLEEVAQGKQTIKLIAIPES